MTNKYVLGGAIVVLLVIGGIVYAKNNTMLPMHGNPPITNDGDGVACAEDARICPDGSYVGRIPPHCDFAACPASTSTPPATAPVETTKEGSVVCLPHKNSSGPQTMECALGLKASDGYYYALNTTASGINIYQYSDGTQKIRVNGTLVYIETVNSDFWQRYDIKGIISIKTAATI